MSGSTSGSFLSDVVGPIVNTIDSVVGPIRPVLDVLNTRLPVLSDLGPTRSLLDRNDDGAVTLLEMAALLGDGADSAATFISALSNVLDVADILDGLSNNGDTVLLDFGSFDLGSLDVRGLTDLTGASPNVTRATNPLDQFKNSGSAEQREAAKKLTAAPGGGFVFPIIENPSFALRTADGQGRHAGRLRHAGGERLAVVQPVLPLARAARHHAGRLGQSSISIWRSASTLSARGDSPTPASIPRRRGAHPGRALHQRHGQGRRHRQGRR